MRKQDHGQVLWEMTAWNEEVGISNGDIIDQHAFVAFLQLVNSMNSAPSL